MSIYGYRIRCPRAFSGTARATPAQHGTAFIITTSMHNKIREIVSRHARLAVPMTELTDTSDLTAPV